jgi:CubicO group peptidase (beta-lactamase class C family)
VSVDGQPVWAAATGWADVTAARQLSTEAVFRIGSTSKAVTATLLARLVDAGTVALDAPSSRYLPRLPNPQWAPLTPRQLASHTAGLPEYDENHDLWGLYQTIRLSRHFDDVVASLEVFDDTPLLSPPGTRFHYTSFDVNLLGAVINPRRSCPTSHCSNAKCCVRWA